APDRSCHNGPLYALSAYLNVIAQVATYHFREENPYQPFEPMVQTRDGQSPVPADLNDENCLP
ncbi:MAG: hypothetical protein OEX74_08425, partial [Gammaproteobacteria bacterium]|nr:hypothetical protein [Gammaproteobacteria bacterium]